MKGAQTPRLLYRRNVYRWEELECLITLSSSPTLVGIWRCSRRAGHSQFLQVVHEDLQADVVRQDGRSRLLTVTRWSKGEFSFFFIQNRVSFSRMQELSLSQCHRSVRGSDTASDAPARPNSRLILFSITERLANPGPVFANSRTSCHPAWVGCFQPRLDLGGGNFFF